MVVTHLIADWNPEDLGFWQQRGCRVARRNLWLSIPALALAFAVWMLWSVVVVYLPAAGFRYSSNQLFWLAALPALCGATLRIFYAFAATAIGGRAWTAISTAALLLPALGIGWAVQRPDTPYELMVALALLCGLGGGNFASSMAHISDFYPRAQKGYALGMNAGLGQLGVALVQFVVPVVIVSGVLGGFGVFGGTPQINGQGQPQWLQNAGFVWVPLIIASALAAWFGMDDIAEARPGFADQAVIFARKHNWLMCWLTLGTFGSFIGFSAGLPLLVQSQFPAMATLHWAWLGPLLGSVMLPLGAWLADRYGGARLIFWCFVAMAAGVLAVMQCLPGPGNAGQFNGFLASFGLLFAAAGLGYGSSLRMIPLIFLAERQRAAKPEPEAQAQALRDGNKEAAAVLGFASALGAYGGFVIPKSYGSAIALTGSPTAALQVFFLFYLSCIAVTWWHYSRHNAPMPC